jgi:hypothetical protein
MVTHLVLLKPRRDLTDADRQAFIDAFERAMREIPVVQAVRVGARVTHGAAYETASPDAADFMAAIDFADVGALQLYLTHPAHAELGRLFGEMLASAVVYDFEIGGITPSSPL